MALSLLICDAHHIEQLTGGFMVGHGSGEQQPSGAKPGQAESLCDKLPKPGRNIPGLFTIQSR